MKRELSKKAKLSIFKAVFVLILTYGHESWVMTERMRSQVQASEMRFLRKIEVVTLFNKVRSSGVRKSTSSRYLRIEDLSLDGLAAECRRKDSPNQLCLPKQMEEEHLNDLELDRLITLWILDGIAWDFTQAK